MPEKNKRLSHFFLIYKPPVLLFLQDNTDFFERKASVFFACGHGNGRKTHCDTDEKDNRNDSPAVLFSDIIEIIFRKGRSLLCR